MSTILDQILADKRKACQAMRATRSLEALRQEAAHAAPRPDFFFESISEGPSLAVIAEIKKKSPSKGLICENFDPVRIALSYEKAGASAISVLTDEPYFGGTPEDLKRVRAAVTLPVLRKDFIVDEIQIYESVVLGADAVLLIAAALTDSELYAFSALCLELGLDILYEAHDEEDVRRILKLEPRIIGINNRDLKTFEVNLATTLRLARLIPGDICVVSESGIRDQTELLALKSMGVKAFLIGESLMKTTNPGETLQKLLGPCDG